MIENPHLFIEYYGSLANQNWFYNGACTTFWTLPDGRQVTDCLNENIYRHLLTTMDNVRPFVPKDEKDWKAIIKLMEAEEKARQAAKKAERISFLEGAINAIAGTAEAALNEAALLISKASELKEKAASVAESAEKFVKELDELNPPAKKPKPEEPKVEAPKAKKAKKETK